MRVQHEASAQLKYDSTFADLKQIVEDAGVPESARVDVKHYEGNQMDPSYTTITFRWETGQ